MVSSFARFVSTEETSNVELDVKLGWLFQKDTDMGLLLARVSCPKIDPTGVGVLLFHFRSFPGFQLAPVLITLKVETCPCIATGWC